MSEPIDWNALTPAQRNALIAEKVMGLHVVYWPPQEHPEYNLRSGYVLPDTFGSPGVPHYSESMGEALASLKHAMQQGTMDKEDLTYELFDTTWGDLSTFDVLEKICTWTPDFVCRALLLAYGVEIK